MKVTMPVQSSLAGQVFEVVARAGGYDVYKEDGSCVRAITRRAVMLAAFGNTDAKS